MKWRIILSSTTKDYLDISWGDEKYYQQTNPGISIGAGAVLWPTQSVLLLYAFSQDITKTYREATILQMTMDQEKFISLCRFVSQSFQRNESGDIQPSTIYRDSSPFFLATKRYSLFRTCNRWVAMAFNKSGFNIHTRFLISANQLIRRLIKVEGCKCLQRSGVIPNVSQNDS